MTPSDRERAAHALQGWAFGESMEKLIDRVAMAIGEAITDEREQCANLADETKDWPFASSDHVVASATIARNIRARGTR